MMFLQLRYAIPREMSNMNWTRVCRDRSWGGTGPSTVQLVFTSTESSEARVLTRTSGGSYKRLFSEPRQQKERVQVSMLHEWENHHRDGQALTGTTVKTDP